MLIEVNYGRSYWNFFGRLVQFIVNKRHRNNFINKVWLYVTHLVKTCTNLMKHIMAKSQ